jgi:hypothetical protein
MKANMVSMTKHLLRAGVIFIVGTAPAAPDMITMISVSCASMPHARQTYDVDAPFRQLRTVSLHLLPAAITT